MVAAGFVILAIALSLIAILGDYFLKRAGEGNINIGFFVAGFIVYALCAFGWFYAFRYMKVSTIAGIYGVTTVILLTAMGVFVFHEKLSWWEISGIGCALVSIAILSRFG